MGMRNGAAAALAALAAAAAAIGVVAAVGSFISAPLLFPRYPLGRLGLPAAAGLVVLALTLAAAAARLGGRRPRFFPRDGDRVTVIGASLLVAVALAAGVAVFATLQARVQALVRENLLETQARRAEAFLDMIELREGNARIAATRPAVARNLKALAAGRDDGSNLANVRAVVEGFLKEGFSAVAYFDRHGRLAAAGGTPAARPDLAVALSTPEKAELLWADGFVLRHRLPVRGTDGEPAGEVSIEQPLPVLTRLSRTPPGRGKTWDMGLCVRRSEQLLCFPQRLTAEPFSTPVINVEGDRLPMTRALAGEKGTLLTRDYRGQYVVAAYGPVGELGLGLVVKVDSAEAFGPIREQFETALWLVLLLAGAGTIVLRAQVKPLVGRITEGEARFRAVAETAGDAIVSADSAGRIVYLNGAARAAFGYGPQELLGRPLTVLMPEEYRARHEQGLRRYVAGRVPAIIGRTLELEAQRKDGTRFAMEISVADWETAGGLFFTAILRDITARKQAERDLRDLNAELDRRVKARTIELATALDGLRASEQHYRMLFEANPHPMWVYDVASLRFLAVNDAAVRHYGYGRAEFLGMSLMDLRAPEDAPAPREGVENPSAGDRHRGVFRHRRKDGSLIRVEVVSESLLFEGKQARLALASDVTERERAEEEIRQLNATLEERVRRRTRELEASNRELEAFSYSVSHDLRAPLRHIGGYAELLKNEAGASLSPTAQRFLGVIRDSATRLGRLIDELLEFSRMGRAELREGAIDMAALVAESIRDVERIEPHGAIEWSVAALEPATGDRAALKQVWVNLLSNAVKYSSKRDVARIAVACEARNGEIAYSVRDNGAGFDLRFADKLFGVFQRLHRPEDFEGTGIGLAHVRRIVARHGGRTWAEGKPGEGATFHFTLPRSREEK